MDRGKKIQIIEDWTGKSEICFQNGHGQKTNFCHLDTLIRPFVVAFALNAAVAYRQPRRHSLVLDPILKYCRALWAITTYNHFTLSTPSYSTQPFLGESVCVRRYAAGHRPQIGL